jgi:hypothetical protein
MSNRNTVNSVKAGTSIIPQPSSQNSQSPILSNQNISSNSKNNLLSSSALSEEHVLSSHHLSDLENHSSTSDEFIPSAPTHAQLFPSSQNFTDLLARVQLLENLLKEKDNKLQLNSNLQQQQHVSQQISPSHVASSSSQSMLNSALHKNKLLKDFTTQLSSPHFTLKYSNSKNDDEEKYSIDINEELRKERMKNNSNKNNYTSPHSFDSDHSSSSSDDDIINCRKCGESVESSHFNLCNRCILKKNKKKLLKQQINILKSKFNSSSPSSSPTVPPLEIPPSSSIKNQFKNIDDTVHQAASSAIKQEKSLHQSVLEKKDEDDSVLGAVIGELFSTSQYQTLRLCRAPTAYSSSQLEKAVNDTITRIGKFGGDVNNAPTWLNAFCTNVYRYKFEVHHCMTILQQCFISEAKAWLEANLPLVANLSSSEASSVKPIEAILLKFKNQYMGATQIKLFRRKLQTSKLSGASVTVRELKKHYEVFVGLVNNIRLCDITASEEYIIQEFVDSLPSRVTDFIGMSYINCKSLDSIYQMAEIALTKHSEYYQSKSDGGLKNKLESLNYIEVGDQRFVEINALQAQSSKYKSKNANNNNNNNNSNNSFSNSSTPQQMLCYHCGEDNHYTGDCRLINSPQTAAGIEVWRKRNEKLSSNYDYDKNYYIEKQKQINARLAGNNSSNNNNNKNRNNNNNQNTKSNSSNYNKNSNNKNTSTPSSKTESSSTARVNFANANDSDSDG